MNRQAVIGMAVFFAPTYTVRRNHDGVIIHTNIGITLVSI